MTRLDVAHPASPHEAGDWPDLSDRTVREELTPVSLKALARLADRWGLTTAEVGQLLGGVSESSWYSWQKSTPAALTVDQLTRISLLVGIYTALHVLHEGPLADDWPRRRNSNALFAGRPPIEVMMAGGIPVLLEVRALLDGRRVGL